MLIRIANTKMIKSDLFGISKAIIFHCIVISLSGLCDAVKSFVIISHVSILCWLPPSGHRCSQCLSLHLFTQFVILADLISRMSQILLVSCSLSATLSELDRITVSLFLLSVCLFLFSFSGLLLSPLHHQLHYTSLLLLCHFPSEISFLSD